MTFADTISLEDVMISIVFTKGMRLPQKTVSSLKELRICVTIHVHYYCCMHINACMYVCACVHVRYA